MLTGKQTVRLRQALALLLHTKMRVFQRIAEEIDKR